MAASFVHCCPICDFTTSTLAQWFSHLRSAHSSDPSFRVTCGIDGCKNTYSKFSSLNSHVYRHHKQRMCGSTNSGQSQNDSSMVQPDYQELIATEDPANTIVMDELVTCEEASSESHVRKNSARFLLHLREAKGLSQVAVDTVVEGCHDLIGECLRKLQMDIKSKIEESEQLNMIDDAFQHCTRPFDGLGNKYQQEKFYVQEFNMIEPIKKELGQTVYKVSGSGSKRRRIATSESVYYYIPILSTLKQVLGREDVLEHINAPRHTSVGLLQDFCDGQEFCEHPLFSSNPSAIQIIAYYDDIEVCNPLGSSSKKHKLGIFLFTIGNLHPKFRSALKCIFLFAVARTDDIRKYTPDVILAPFVSDINALASTGVTVTSSTGSTQTFKGTLLAVLADNLASHAIGGFKESFSLSYRFCRSCMTTHAQAGSHFLSHMFSQRTPLSHKRHCDLLTGPLGAHHSTTYGVNRWSILGDISNFSVVTNLPHDVMHDLLEGIVHDELTHLINHCLSCKYFKLENLNERILSFDYGYSEGSNKPAVIDSVSAFVIKLRQSASQMWLLSRSLPLLIGHFVPVDDMGWQCFGLLLTILDICTSHSISADSVAYLITLIEEHHALFKEVYPHAPYTPKMHFLVHYPEQILRFGPVIYSWTMRYESKLKLCKQAAKFGNFKNICYSVAQKHQRWLCYQLQASRYLSEVPEIGGQSTVLSFGEESVAIKHLLSSMEISDDALICHPTWIKYFNCMYKVNCVLLLTCTCNELPTFGKVLDILVLPDNTVHFYTKSLITEYHDDHYHAFVVKESLEGRIMTLASLDYPFVLHLYSNTSKVDRNLYIVPKYGVLY